jgi:hypothetical protein
VSMLDSGYTCQSDSDIACLGRTQLTTACTCATAEGCPEHQRCSYVGTLFETDALAPAYTSVCICPSGYFGDSCEFEIGTQGCNLGMSLSVAGEASYGYT